MDVAPIYASEEDTAVVEEANPTKDTNTQTQKSMIKVAKVPQSLMHNRMGHRPISTLLLAQESAQWGDVVMTDDTEAFCETCRITTAKRRNRGKANLEDLADMVPGMFLMIDVVYNPVSESITPNTYF